jgi:type II secretory pathway pseudopilin PulG
MKTALPAADRATARAPRGQFRRHRSSGGIACRRQSAFTMVEIAIALGVIGFALVAIIGILPSGLQVQRDNRSETIINQDATFWLEAIRSGAQGIDDLTNWVELVSLPESGGPVDFRFGPAGLSGNQFTYGSDIISLLTTAKRFGQTNAVQPTLVNAIVTAISGSAADKDSNRNNRELSFRYRLTVEITNAAPADLVGIVPPLAVGFAALNPQPNPPLPLDPPEPLASLFEMQLTFSYPYIEGKPSEPRNKTYRATVSRNVLTNLIGGREYYLFTP